MSEYNARCADRPRNPVLLNQVQATLVCPPPLIRACPGPG